MPPAQPSLLFVDDDVSAIKVMGRLLAQYGDQRFATSAAEALRQARASVPDLILVDADMPGMSGFDLCRELKRDHALAAVPVIVATAHAGPEFEVRAFECGAADFVCKPLVPEQLRARVRAQLRGAGVTAEAPGPANTRERPLMLLADDDWVSLRALESVLAPLGELHFATDGEQALRLMHELEPDLVVLDAGMPAMSGYEVCAAIKQDPHTRHVPVIFVTRFDDPPAEARALDLGAADFIGKPFNAAVVRARVRNIVELKRRNDEALAAAREHWRMVGDARVAEIVRGVGDGIVTVNARGRIVLANPAACRMLGQLDSQLVGQPFASVFGIEPLPPLEPADAEPVERELVIAGRLRVELRFSVVGAGEETLTTVVMRDLSQREMLRAEADRRLRAEERSRTLTTMVAYLAHEVGNPVHGILGLTRLLAQPPGPGSARLDPARLVALLQTCAEQLHGVTQDFIDIGRLESGRFRIEPAATDVGACIEAAVATMSALAVERGVSLRARAPDPPLQARADRARLVQVLVNLVSNALKYNQRGGQVSLRALRDGDRVYVEVADDGLGMSAAQIERLFEPFNRLGRGDSPVHGQGLGLALCRQLVVAMGGTIDVSSQSGQGTFVRVGLAADAAPGPAAAPAPERSGRPA